MFFKDLSEKMENTDLIRGFFFYYICLSDIVSDRSRSGRPQNLTFRDENYIFREISYQKIATDFNSKTHGVRIDKYTIYLIEQLMIGPELFPATSPILRKVPIFFLSKDDFKNNNKLKNDSKICQLSNVCSKSEQRPRRGYGSFCFKHQLTLLLCQIEYMTRIDLTKIEEKRIILYSRIHFDASSDTYFMYSRIHAKNENLKINFFKDSMIRL
ncbi:hypothetical protein BpHYR1_016079 [Brachionus plicatilis]|uniref:Uncharacterized protein n=1 Tax=Brachionus plicatilis TaxID=10195 RepID=A0A3M7SLG1_BRAPC|nr:hypothetical protein BpHYR1_016079 [Brachionus plicatilis]